MHRWLGNRNLPYRLTIQIMLTGLKVYVELKTYRTKVSRLQGNITNTGRGEKSNKMGGYKVNINVIKRWWWWSVWILFILGYFGQHMLLNFIRILLFVDEWMAWGRSGAINSVIWHSYSNLYIAFFRAYPCVVHLSK